MNDVFKIQNNVNLTSYCYNDPLMPQVFGFGMWYNGCSSDPDLPW